MEKLGEGEGLPAGMERSRGAKQLHRYGQWGSGVSTEGTSRMLTGRGARPKRGQTQLLCPPPAGQQPGGSGSPVPAAYYAT